MKDRRTEWFVPSLGPLKLRIFIGLLFLPYTGMVLAYSVIGSMLANQIHWDRVGAILVIYFVALGVGAHALDALGSRGVKPWGKVFSKGQLWALAISSIVAAYAIGIYYMVLYTPLLSSAVDSGDIAIMPAIAPCRTMYFMFIVCLPCQDFARIGRIYNRRPFARRVLCWRQIELSGSTYASARGLSHSGPRR